MSIARAFSRVLRKHFHMHPAWLPITSSVALGDYGLWRGGVFVPLGNVKEFGVDVQPVAGQTIKLDFQSSKVRMTKLHGNIPVAAFPAGALRAELRFEMAAAQSFVLKAAEVTSTRVSNVGPITRALAASWRRRGRERWRLRYKVVSELFVGTDVVLLASTSKSTSVSVRGSGSELTRLEQGRAGAGLEFSSSKQLGLQVLGGHGPIGLGLFRVRASGIPMVDFAGDDLPEGAFVDDEGNFIEPEDVGWDQEPVDDLEEEDPVK